MAIDPLDIAYIAIGAQRAFAAASAANARQGTFEGELGFIEACISHADMLDRFWQLQDGGFPGVWCYDVAEPFGEAFGHHLLTGGLPTDAERILQAIVDAVAMPCT